MEDLANVLQQYVLQQINDALVEKWKISSQISFDSNLKYIFGTFSNIYLSSQIYHESINLLYFFVISQVCR